MDGIFENDIPNFPDYPTVYTPEYIEPSQPLLGPMAGRSSGNTTPEFVETMPVSKTSYVSDLANKVLDSKYAEIFLTESARARFGRNSLPTGGQGGKTQTSVGIMNPVPANWLQNPFSSTAQPNESLAVLKGSGGIMIAIIALLILFLFVRR